ncbi:MULTISPECIES: VOC family protein [Solibacillus]|uniref:VOC family protein n=1 Tax=Solibacillus merdavium TaxID=2762218 RepID=A0ABR8XQ35_9BACL|nr:VOC family protein [Solibacillus merdavium]MBD8034054.1 VOC family protein [Solibacillus merdavium]
MNQWTETLHIAQFRIARPTDKLEQVERFYCEGLGLKKLGGFKGHRGYTGIMIGLPDASYHLEFTEHIDGSPCPAPTEDNLLVFYMPDSEQIQAVQSRLAKMGYPKVPPENPYWEEKGVTIADPDGWRIVLMNTEGI